MQAMTLAGRLSTLVGARLDEPRLTWWQQATGPGLTPQQFFRAFGGAGRRLGSEPLELSATEKTLLKEAPQSLDGWPLALAGRLALLLLALEQLPESEHVGLLEELFRTGSLDEQVALLRALAWLPDAERFMSIAASGARTNAAAILEAIACDNPYPAPHFDERAWNQLVMKAVFYELPLSRVLQLDRRNNPELTRMARDFADERRAAGRAVPADLHLIEGALS